jgi:hypothetical protein
VVQILFREPAFLPTALPAPALLSNFSWFFSRFEFLDIIFSSGDGTMPVLHLEKIREKQSIGYRLPVQAERDPRTGWRFN